MSENDMRLRRRISKCIEARRSEIIETYRRQLVDIDSALVAEEKILDQVLGQAQAVITDVVGSVSENQPWVNNTAKEVASRIGWSRAAYGVSPAESLRAAGALFEIVAGAIARARSDDPADGRVVRDAMVTLNRSIMARIEWASEGYLSFLLTEVGDASLADRRRTARDLHDRVGSQASLALRALDLVASYQQSDPVASGRHLEQARTAVIQTIDAVREVAGGLQDNVRIESLSKALTAFTSAMSDSEVIVSTEVNGDESWVPVAILEELFYVLQEALRNSFQHARAGAVICVVDITPSGVSGVVVDDGAGFDTRSADRAGIGLTSMRERVKLIGGYLTITSGPGSGTRVRVSIPLKSRE